MEPTIFKPRLKFKPPLKFFKFGHWNVEITFDSRGVYAVVAGGAMGSEPHWISKIYAFQAPTGAEHTLERTIKTLPPPVPHWKNSCKSL